MSWAAIARFIWVACAHTGGAIRVRCMGVPSEPTANTNCSGRASRRRQRNRQEALRGGRLALLCIYRIRGGLYTRYHDKQPLW
jgi:hypothetical protein